ncbi:MAG: hypothetical protein Q9191_004068 [Dirinaria sp. TL-2023a]
MAGRAEAVKDPSETGSVGTLDFGDIVDTNTFEQILEMDEDEEEREFSRSIVYGFFEQVEVTFKQMDGCLEERDLAQLSSQGHFLKGSSATLGLTKIKDSCEKIQHYGARKDESGSPSNLSEEECLRRIRAILKDVKEEYKDAERVLRRFYHDAS